MATYWQCKELSIIWFGTSQLSDIVMKLQVEMKHAAFIIEHHERSKRKPNA
jgi:hypothetical protein